MTAIIVPVRRREPRCEVCPGRLRASEGVVRVRLDDRSRAIHLCAAHREQLEAALAPFLDAMVAPQRPRSGGLAERLLALGAEPLLEIAD